MSLVSRKPRPLAREEGQLRDTRLFIVACDDTYAPAQYFGFFQIPRIHVHVLPTTDGTSAAQHVLERLLSFEHEEDDELWMLLDTDHYIDDGHFKSFIQAIQNARQQGVNVAISKPCFEFWLLLHHHNEEAVRDIKNSKEAEMLLRQTLGSYNKRLLRAEHYPVGSVASACQQAKTIDKITSGSDRPQVNTSRVYKLWESVFLKSAPAQLPEDLQELMALIKTESLALDSKKTKDG